MITLNIESLSSVDTLLNYRTEKTVKYEPDLAVAYIADRDEVDKINPNDSFEIKQDGTVIFSGFVRDINYTANPKEIKAYGKLEVLKGYECRGRVFYNEKTSNIINNLITQKAIDNGRVYTNVGDINTNVSGSFSGDSSKFYFEQTGFENLDEAKFGNDTIFSGIEEKSRGEIQITFDNVDYLGDDFKSLYINGYWNTYGEFSVEVEYYEDGLNYLWNDLNENLRGYERINIAKEDAEDSGNLSTENRLQIRINTNGRTQEPRAVAIDAIGYQSIDIVQRDINISVGDVSVTNDSNITRKFSENLYDALRKINDRIPNKIIHDTQNIRTVKLAENNYTLDDSKIIGIDKEFNANNIINKVVVSGKDIKVRESNQDSIDFYGISNVKRIQDKSISSDIDAKKTAQNILDNAFADTKLSIKTPYKRIYNDITTGDELEFTNISIPSNGSFVIESVEISENNELIINASNKL